MKARIALAGYWLTVIFLTASAGVIIYKLIFWPLCTSSAPRASNCTVVDSWTIAGVTATVLGVSATLLAILGALAVAAWWTGLEERVSKQIARLVEEQKQELYKTREALIFMNSGNQLLSQKQVTEALEDFKKAKNLLPQDPHLNYVLSNYFLDVGDYNSAIAALNDAQFRDIVDQAKVQRKLGLAHRHRWEDLKRDQDFDLALQYLKDAAVSNPNDSKTFTLLGGLYRPETPRHKWTGVLLGFPSIVFTFGVQTLHSSGPSQVARPRSELYATVAPVLLPDGPVLRLTPHTPRVRRVVFVRVQWTQRVVHLARSLVNTFVFLPAVLRRRTHKHDSVVKVRQTSVPQLNTY